MSAVEVVAWIFGAIIVYSVIFGGLTLWVMWGDFAADWRDNREAK